VGLFRRKQETLNEQLLREAGLDPAQTLDNPTPPPEPEPEPLDPPRFSTGDINLGHGRRGRPPEWNTVATARAPGLAGDHVEFTTLPNGDVIVEEEKGDGDLSPLADAVERRLEPPYRAVAARQGGDLWGVGAVEIAVVKFELAEGDAVELTENDGVQELRVDGEPGEAEIPELARLGEEAGADYCVEAKRIDGNFWEVEVSAL
jgi:hypothetical protein